MTTNYRIRSILHAATMSRSAKQMRMLRGQFGKAINNAHLSDALAESAKREFERIAARSLSKNPFPAFDSDAPA
jgi:hypothetical protein